MAIGSRRSERRFALKTGESLGKGCERIWVGVVFIF
jgi:hypothetical protein